MSDVIPLFLVPRGAQPRPHVRLSLEEVADLFALLMNGSQADVAGRPAGPAR